MKHDFKKKKGIFPLLFIAIIFALSGIVMLLWNAILPDLLSIKTITYWQSMGLLVLTRILFGRLEKPNRPKFANRKFRGMTPEEKEEFRDKWKNKNDKQ
ncbi:hypothetical protein GCM10022393_19960 [Aquimarina addita]|uniref:DUF4133 domain-containing protein n=1 Tax=Aquimarina addita TaxID=870485 RepID=A0ABP6UKY0_9FLAO